MTAYLCQSTINVQVYFCPAFRNNRTGSFGGRDFPCLAHLGGAIPYLAERLDRGYYAFQDCRDHIDKPPSEYLKDFYYDTVNFDLKALQLAIDFAGADHLVARSDYPHQIGSLEKMVDSIEKLNISSKDKEAIFGANASKLLEITP